MTLPISSLPRTRITQALHALSPLAAHALAAAALLSAGCSGAPSDVETPAATATASASVAPVTSPPGTATAAADSTAAANTPPPAPESKFVAVATLPGAVRLFPIEGAMMVAREETVEVQPDGKWGVQIGRLDGDAVDFGARHVLEGMHSVVEIRGTWPGDVHVLATGDTGRTGIAEHYLIDGKGLRASSAKTGRYFVGVAQVGSSLLALEAPSMPFDLPKVVSVIGAAQTFKVTPADAAKCEYQKSAILPSLFGSTSKGTLLSYGQACSGAASIEMWTAAGKPSTITDLTSFGDVDATALVSGGAGDAWLLGKKLLHFDGAAWKEHPAPEKEALSEGAVAPDGTFWATGAAGSVFALQSGAWRNEPLPAGAKANHLAIGKDGTVWITTETSLLRTRRTNDGEGLKVDAKSAAPPKRKRAFAPGSPRCTSNVVVLYAFTKVTPDDYDFPLTRKAIKGHGELSKVKFVVTKDAGQKYFTAMVPDFATANKVREIIEKGVQGAKPAIVCAEPEVVREVKINLTTGDVVK